MMVSDQDYELLSAYLDGELDTPSQTVLENRLRSEPELQRELDNLRRTVQLLSQLPPRKAPRDFRLTPGMVQASPAAEVKPRLGFIPTTAAFSALSAAAAVILIGLSVVLFQNQNTPLSQADSAAAPVAMQITATASDSPQVPLAAPAQNTQSDTNADSPPPMPPTETLDTDSPSMPPQPTIAMQMQQSAPSTLSTEAQAMQSSALDVPPVTPAAADGMLGTLVAAAPTLLGTPSGDAALLAAPAVAGSADAPGSADVAASGEVASMAAGSDAALTVTSDPASAVLEFAVDATLPGLLAEAERSSLTATPPLDDTMMEAQGAAAEVLPSSAPEDQAMNAAAGTFAALPSPAPTRISAASTVTPPPTRTPPPTAAPVVTVTPAPLLQERQATEAGFAPVILLLMGVFLLALAGITTWMRRR
jgi:hypothetical protein